MEGMLGHSVESGSVVSVGVEASTVLVLLEEVLARGLVVLVLTEGMGVSGNRERLIESERSLYKF